MLLDKYAPFLMSIALRYSRDSELSKDIVQESWIKIFNNIDQYSVGTNLKAWLAKITVNTALKYRGKFQTLEITNCGESAQLYSNLLDVDDQLAYEDLLKLVDCVDSPARDVFMMFVLDGMSHREIGEIMDIAESTSRVHLTNARKSLRNMLSIRKIERV